MEEIIIDKITEKIISSAPSMSNTLRIGFVEKVYENSHAYQMRKDSLKVVQHHLIKVEYDDVAVGEFLTDMLGKD